MIANTGLLSMIKLFGAELPDDIQNDIRTVQDAMLFYEEHTFGAAESISDPYSENSMVQWGEKSSYAWDAVMKSHLLKEKAMGFIQPHFNKSDVPTLLVFNTLNWNRTGLAKIFIDHEIIPVDKDFKILDKDGHEVKAQLIGSKSGGSYWGLWVEDIPSFGYKTYGIELLKENKRLPAETQAKSDFENAFYKIIFDKSNGSILSIFDKELQLELTEANDSINAGEFIYEQLDNRHQLERYTSSKVDTLYKPLQGERYLLHDVQQLSIKDGPVWKSLYLNGKLKGCVDDGGVIMEIRLYHDKKQIEFFYSMVKLAVTTPESIYIAFPFGLEDGQLFFEAQGGMVEPGVNQLEGTSSDWNTIQHFASVRNAKNQIVFSSNDIPLVQFGDINTGRFYYKHRPETSHIYSWVLNNYWTTNFRASQEGELKWSYSITSDNDVSNSFATRFGWESSIPFLTRVLPKGNTHSPLEEDSLINIDAQNILLVNAKPSKDGQGIILHIRETDGKPASIDLSRLVRTDKIISFSKVNVLEEKIRDLSDKIELVPNEVLFIKVSIID